MGDIFVSVLLAALLALLVSAGVEDVRRREIANWKNATIALLAPAWWLAGGMTLPGMVGQVALAAAVFGLFVVAFHLGQMGGGDVKMIGALALWLPMQPLLWMLTLMALLGGALTLLMLADKWVRCGGTPEIPYGVAIAMATLLVLSEPNINQFG